MFIKTFKEQYPSRLECFLVYPSNFIFNAIWALVKPFLDAKSKGSAFLLSSKVGGAVCVRPCVGSWLSHKLPPCPRPREE